MWPIHHTGRVFSGVRVFEHLPREDIVDSSFLGLDDVLVFVLACCRGIWLRTCGCKITLYFNS